MNSKFCILIVAGGSGSRMKTDIPKQFLNLNGEPVIIRTMRAFLNVDSNFEFVISVHENYKSWLYDALRNHQLSHIKIHIITDLQNIDNKITKEGVIKTLGTSMKNTIIKDNTGKDVSFSYIKNENDINIYIEKRQPLLSEYIPDGILFYS